MYAYIPLQSLFSIHVYVPPSIVSSCIALLLDSTSSVDRRDGTLYMSICLTGVTQYNENTISFEEPLPKNDKQVQNSFRIEGELYEDY